MKFSTVKEYWQNPTQRDMYCENCDFESDNVMDAHIHEAWHKLIHKLFGKPKHETAKYW